MLDQDPENAEAYLGKLMVDLKLKKQSEFSQSEKPLEASGYYSKTLRFADEGLKRNLQEANTQILARLQAQKKTRKQKTGKTLGIAAAVIVLALAAFFGTTKILLPQRQYKAAEALVSEGKYEEAIAAFEAMAGYKDSEAQIKACRDAILDETYRPSYDRAEALYETGAYEEAIAIYETLDGYKDSEQKASAADAAYLEKQYSDAQALEEAGSLTEAAEIYEALGEYKDCVDCLKRISEKLADAAFEEKQYDIALEYYTNLEQTDELKEKEYQLAQVCFDEGHYEQAVKAYAVLEQYELSANRLTIARYSWADQLQTEGNYEKAAEQFGLLNGVSDSAEREQECRYQVALQLLSSGEAEKAEAILQEMADYSDAASQLEECRYVRAEQAYEAEKYAEALELYESVPEHSGSAERISSCRAQLGRESYEKGEYDAAIALLSDAGDEESLEVLALCHTAKGNHLMQQGSTNAAVSEYAQALSDPEAVEMLCSIGKDFITISDYEDAVETLWIANDESARQQLAALAEKLKTAKPTLAFAALSAAEDYEGASALLSSVTLEDLAALDFRNLTEENIGTYLRYSYGRVLQRAGQDTDAYSVFEALGDYRDSAEILATLHMLEVGDTVVLGHYEQDNNTSNGKEEIEWLVLDVDKENRQALLISKYALDCKPYNETYKNITWEECSLRTWLNGTFLNAAFSAEEQAGIVTTKVTADKNPSYSTDPGNDTNDKVFLLSITEVNQYFSNNDARKCAPTDYAIAQGANTSNSYTAGGRATGWWWLRSPGLYSSSAAGVRSAGSVYSRGSTVLSSRGVIRPALWVKY